MQEQYNRFHPFNATPPIKLSTKRANRVTGPLGSTAKSATDRVKTAAIPGLEALEGVLQAAGLTGDRQIYRRRRYWLADVAQAVMATFIDTKRCKDGVERSVTRYKVCMCGRTSFNGLIQVDLTTRGAVYRTMKCGSVWHCPLCSAVISSVRARELLQGIRRAEELGYITLLVTYTARHNAQTDLATQYRAMTLAHRRVWSGGDVKALKARLGILGLIRNLEVTWSRVNGWHVHIHSLVFIKRVDSDEAMRALIKLFEDIFRARWEAAAAEQGLTMNERGYDVTNSTARVAEYVAKFGHDPRWRESDELTKWHKKTGREWRNAKGLTPWQLLEFAASGNEEAADLFRQYAVVFHGKKQLHWSEGLKDLLGVAEKKDQEIVEEEQEAPILLSVVVPVKEFAERIAKRRARAHYLEIIELNDPDQIQQLCGEFFGIVPQVLRENE